ncbi:MAG TPA: glycosyltransferase [Elusimicrobiota bacterium]|nr:glycosyltransferase [Elusimicrobiota bacterium]
MDESRSPDRRPREPGREDAASPALTSARRLLLISYMISAAAYFAWRLTVFNARAPLFSAAFYCAELIGFLWGLNLLLGGLRLDRREPPPPPPGLAVDVFIPTYDEPVDLVRRTLVAALRIEYAHLTWLLDDGGRPEMRALARELGCRYLARGGNANAKAGNLNHALGAARGEFVAIFDADHVADPRFLDRTLGFFRDDPRLAFVQTPQEFHNFDSYQHLGGDRARGSWNEHSLFYRLIQRSRDRRNAAMLCGCSVVLRRAALDAVGGFAVGTVTEDMHTSVRLHAAGWNSVFHSETLSAGLGPLDALSYRRQRLRWAQGSLQVFMRERLPVRPGLTGAQREAYLLHVLSILEGWRTAFICVAPAGVLVFGVWPMESRLGPWAAVSLPYFALSVLAFEEIARGQGRFFKNEVFNVARCTSQIRALFSAGGRLAFHVTPKVRLKDHAKIGFVFPWLVLAWTAAALAAAAWRLAEGRSALGRGCLGIAVVWAVFGAASCARLCGLTRRCARNRRASTRFPVEFAARLRAESSPGDVREAVITDVSPGGLTLRAASARGLPAGPCVAAFTVLGREYSLRVGLRPHSPRTSGGPLLGLEAAARDDFEHAIHVDRIRYLARFDRNDRWTLLGPLVELIRSASREPELSPSEEL